MARRVAALLLVIASAPRAGAATDPPLLPFRDDKTDKVGFIDPSGKVVIPPTFVDVGPFREGLAPVCRAYTEREVTEDGNDRTLAIAENWEFIDRTGRTVIPGPFLAPKPFSSGLASVQDPATRARGYIDHGGRFVIPPQYGEAETFHEGLASVRLAGEQLQGAIDPTGKQVIPPRFAGLRELAGGRAAFWDGKKHGYVDREGTVVVPAIYGRAEPFSEGLAYVEMAGGEGAYIDEAGAVVIRGLAVSGGPFGSGRARLYGGKAGKWIDRHGATVITGTGWVGDFHEGLASIAAGKKRGYVDPTGKIVIAPRWDFAGDFQDGVAVVGDVGPGSVIVNQRYIDRRGRVIAKASSRAAVPAR